jgi:nitrate/nitrite transport system permease protein
MAGSMSEADVRKAMPYSGSPTYVDQILTSLKTVLTGFLIATAIGIPLGILCGLSQAVYEMFNPIIQVLKPVSPLAWMPIVGIVIGAVVANDAGISKSYLIAAVVVGICAVWPTMINTANGVANVERDHLNVARVLNLGFFARIRRIILPAALPSIFTGMRMSLGVGWMVLIAAEMLSQNPGLGKFVWDMYQSSSDQTLATIMVAVITIGAIGFLLDRTMIAAQTFVSHGATASIR